MGFVFGHSHPLKLQKCKIVINSTLRVVCKYTQGAWNIWFPQVFTNKNEYGKECCQLSSGLENPHADEYLNLT